MVKHVTFLVEALSSGMLVLEVSRVGGGAGHGSTVLAVVKERLPVRVPLVVVVVRGRLWRQGRAGGSVAGGQPGGRGS